MTHIHESISFDEINTVLTQAEALLGAAEAHGLQAGMICGQSEETRQVDWLSVMMQELSCKTSDSACREVLSKLYRNTVTQLSNLSFDFMPLLPDDEAAFDLRVTALGSWCRGFLCGLGMAGIGGDIQSSLAKEAISDLSKIAYSDTSGGEGLEEDEAAYFELVEYIRIAVQTVQVEIQYASEDQAAQKAPSRSILH